MLDKIIRLVIKGDTSGVDDAAKKTEGALAGLGDKVSGLAKAFGALVAGVALGKFFKDSVDEATAAEKGMARLGVAVTNTGNDFKSLSPALEQTIKSVQKMSTATDDDLREALTRMISVSGDVKGSMANLSVVADLAAYKQINVADAADIVAKAMNGNFVALNKMGIAGKDVTTVMQNLSAAVGGQAQAELETFGGAVQVLNNKWNDFKEAVGVAILSGGGMTDTAKTLAERLGDLAKWVEQNSATFGAMANAVASAGEFAIRAFVQVIQWAQMLGVEMAALYLSIGPKFREAIGSMLQAMGEFIGENRVLLTIFGDGLTTIADGMANTGAKMQREAVRALGFVQQASIESYQEILGITKQGEDAITDASAKAGKRRTGNAADEAKQAKAIREKTDAEVTAALLANLARWEATVKKEGEEGRKIYQELGEILKDTFGTGVQTMIEATAEEIDVMAKRAGELYANGRITKEEFEKIQARVHALKGGFAELLPTQQEIEASAKLILDHFTASNEAVKHNTDSAGDLLSKIGDNAQKALEVGEAFGLVDDKAKAVLSSVIAIGENIGKALGGDVASMIGVLGGLANLIGNWGNSAAEQARKQTLYENTQALERVSRELGNFNLGATGKTFNATQNALAAAAEAAKQGGPGGAIAAVQTFKASLISQGVSVRDAEALLKELGFDPNLSSPGTFASLLPTLISGLGQTEFGQFGQDFESQLRAVTEGFGILGVTDPKEQFTQLSALASRFSPALAGALQSDDPQAALKALFGQLQTGELADNPAAFGSLNAGQFLDLLKLLIPIAVPTSFPIGDKGNFLPTPGTGSIPLPMPTGIEIGAVPSLIDNLGPAVPSLIDALGHSPRIGTSVGTIIQGDVVQNFNVTTDDPKELAGLLVDELDMLFAQRYTQQQAAAGATAV